MYGPYPYYTRPTTSIIKNATANFSWAKLFSGTQKTLGFINQAIPAFYNIQPVIRNAKTMFRVLNEFKKDQQKPINSSFKNNTTVNDHQEKIVNPIENFNSPTFFQ